MASTGFSAAHGKRLSVGHHSTPNASLIMEKQKATLRRSTPDSEALVSSEDELDVQQRAAYVMAGQSMKPVRRPSWINESHHSLHRKSSLGSSEPRSPGGSQHIAPTPDSSSWSATSSSFARNSSATVSLPWSSTIWNSDNQKGLPSRFAEVLPSPTTFDALSNFSDDVMQSPTRRESATEASFPFAIPLQPTLKSYRSQSYSVGQMDQEHPNNTLARTNQNAYGVRARTASSYSGLQHRPSRPSMLSEFSADTALGQLREVEDDEESTTSSGARDRLSSTQARQIEQLAMENAILRQQAQMSQSMSLAISNPKYTSNLNAAMRSTDRGLQISDSVLEEPDDERRDDDDVAFTHTSSRRGFGARRQSEYATSNGPRFPGPASEQKYPVNGKKGHWQSSLGFGRSIDQPTSRRHSFADIPIRLASSSGMKTSPLGASEGGIIHEDVSHTLNSQYSSLQPINQAHNAGDYVNRQPDSLTQASFTGYLPRRLQTYGQHQTHLGQSLYLVTFKAARAEFYYVQDGMGLEVNPGDLVIVEADRGTDLGTVAHKNVDWLAARELKERYVAEHYNWLMMFSRQGQNNSVASTNGWGNQLPPERIQPQHGGTSTSSANPLSMDGANTEIKPKMIKRLAQNHEIHTLREKEGNEAKAKRMCQTKVVEHHLNMEILDAEFQMDWKKLTFYYFADAYINFNSLVTDLFKIYKTRIWMSAINPASFVSMNPVSNMPFGHTQPSIKPDDNRLADDRHGAKSSIPAHSSANVAFGHSWQNQQESSSAMVSLGPYAQYWTGAGAQQANAMPQSYTQGNGASFHTSPTHLPSHYALQNASRPQLNVDHDADELDPSSYTDQLQAIQGLSIGQHRWGM